MPVQKKTKASQWSRNSTGFYKAILALVVLIAVAEAVYILYPSTLVTNTTMLTIPDLSLNGFVKVDNITPSIDPNSGLGSLALGSGCYQLSAGVEPDMAQSISDGLQGTVGPRPDSHDIIRDIFQPLKINVLMVKITNQQDNLFFSKLMLRQGNMILNLDARPSDAIAIAVREKAPVYINETLLRTAGKSVC